MALKEEAAGAVQAVLPVLIGPEGRRAETMGAEGDGPARLAPEATLNPPPSTLNPQPSTLNPQPSTLNPKPSTLNPKP